MPRRIITQPQTATVKLWCLLIGVSEYQDKTLRSLPYAIADSQGLAKALKEANHKFRQTEIIEHNFQIDSKPYLSKVRGSLQQIVKSANPEDTLFFYFSGHGMLEPQTQQAVLCLTDTQTDNLLNTSLTIQELLQMLGNCQAAQQVVVLDACHSGGLTLRNSPTPNLLEQLQKVASQKKQTSRTHGFYALLSCDKDQLSWEFPDLGHGLYTYFLIRGMLGEAADERGRIEVISLHKYAYHQTTKYIDKLNLRRRLINQQKRSQGETEGLEQEQPSQNPKLIAEAVGELFLGNQTAEIETRSRRQALIVDGLSSGESTLAISKILKSAGAFKLKYWHHQVRDLPDVYAAIQNCLFQPKSVAKFAISPSTSLLYLRGKITETEAGEALLVIDDEIFISRDWLRQILRQSNIAYQIVILDCPVIERHNKNYLQDWLEDLRQEAEFSQCLIIGASTGENPEELATALLKTLQTANPETGLSVAEWITGVQRELATSNIWRDYWLGGMQGVIEVLPTAVQPQEERVDLGICPYMGLKAFSEKDARYFYGQEALTQSLINEVNQQPFLAVIGASGSGKSSVVQAGLIAQLRQGKQIPSSETWSIKCFRPGENPLQELARIMANGEDNPLQTEGLLHLGGEGFVRWLRTRIEPMVVLVIDQFEEIFTLTPASDRQFFLDILLEALEYATDRFKLIITLRADFIASCLEVAKLSKKLQESHILVPPRLTAENYRQIIEKPAEQVELTVQPGLVDLLLQDLQQSAGDLPLLQFVLEQLWEHRDQNTGELTVQAYRQIGGIKVALERKAQAVFESLDSAEKTVAEWIFLSLTRLGEGTEDSKRQVSKTYLYQGRYSPFLVEKTLQKFIAAKLIVVKQAEDELEIGQSRNATEISQELELIKTQITVEVAHEILIRHWSTLRWWLDKNRARLHEQQRLENKVKEWEQKGKHLDFLLQKTELKEAEAFYHKYKDYLTPQQREYIQASQQARRKNRLILGSISSIVILSICASGIFAWQQQQQNQLAQLIRSALSNNMTPDIAKSIFNSFPQMLTNAETNQKSGNIEQALNDYRQILNITVNLEQNLAKEPQIFAEIVNQKSSIKKASQQAENSIAQIIQQSRLPHLEAELKKGNFGKLVNANLKQFENQYTGASKITYAILMGKQGAKADENNDGYLSEGEEKYLPCETLKDIEKLWRKYTENRCSWYGGNDQGEQPACRELAGKTLTSQLFWSITIPLVQKRLQECQLIANNAKQPTSTKLTPPPREEGFSEIFTRRF